MHGRTWATSSSRSATSTAPSVSFTQSSQLYHCMVGSPGRAARRRGEDARQARAGREEGSGALRAVGASATRRTAGSRPRSRPRAMPLGRTSWPRPGSISTPVSWMQRRLRNLATGTTADAQAAYRQSKAALASTSALPPPRPRHHLRRERRLGNRRRRLFARYFDDSAIDMNAFSTGSDQVRAHEGADAALQAIAGVRATTPMNATRGARVLARGQAAGSQRGSSRAPKSRSRRTYRAGRSRRTASVLEPTRSTRAISSTSATSTRRRSTWRWPRRRDPADVETWFAKAELAAAKGNAADASAALQKAALVDPVNPITALVKAGKFGPTVAAPTTPAPTTPAPAPKK